MADDRKNGDGQDDIDEQLPWQLGDRPGDQEENLEQGPPPPPLLTRQNYTYRHVHMIPYDTGADEEGGTTRRALWTDDKIDACIATAQSKTGEWIRLLTEGQYHGLAWPLPVQKLKAFETKVAFLHCKLSASDLAQHTLHISGPELRVLFGGEKQIVPLKIQISSATVECSGSADGTGTGASAGASADSPYSYLGIRLGSVPFANRTSGLGLGTTTSIDLESFVTSSKVVHCLALESDPYQQQGGHPPVRSAKEDKKPLDQRQVKSIVPAANGTMMTTLSFHHLLESTKSVHPGISAGFIEILSLRSGKSVLGGGGGTARDETRRTVFEAKSDIWHHSGDHRFWASMDGMLHSDEYISRYASKTPNGKEYKLVFHERVDKPGWIDNPFVVWLFNKRLLRRNELLPSTALTIAPGNVPNKWEVLVSAPHFDALLASLRLKYRHSSVLSLESPSPLVLIVNGLGPSGSTTARTHLKPTDKHYYLSLALSVQAFF